MIDFSELALSPNESRAARNFLGLSQAQAAEQSTLQAHKLKRFEAGNYVPDSQFLDELRAFYEGQGYDFHDDQSPGAKAKANGDVFPSGVLGETAGFLEETDSSPSVASGKLPRPQKANVQFIRITPALQDDQIDRVFACIESNEEAIQAAADSVIERSFLLSLDGPVPVAAQARAVALLRRLAENGLLYARLTGRSLLPLGQESETRTVDTVKTVGALLDLAMTGLQLAVIDGDKDSQAQRKARVEPKGVLQALVG